MKFIECTQFKDKNTDLKFGKNFTDYMFMMEYHDGKWDYDNACIKPYAPFVLDPSTSVFHYGQAVFEGLKAYRNDKGEVRLFRPMENMRRMNDSCARVCIPQFDPDFLHDALVKLVITEKDWIPTAEGTSLYIRPFAIATDKALGVHAAHNYILAIILSPVGAYYAHGFDPVSLYVEEHYKRACKGGTGHHKVAGNYAASILASEEAERRGYDQTLWLDAAENKYMEEVGSMNIFFVLNGVVVTPMLGGSILPGITRKSTIELLKARGYNVEERRVSVDEVVKAAEDGTLNEVFGTGTAAVVSPVGSFGYLSKKYTVGDGKLGKITKYVYDELTGIQTGKRPDEFGWVERIV